MALKGKVIAGLVAAATAAGGMAAGYHLGRGDKAEVQAEAFGKGYQAANVKAPQDGDDTRFQLSGGVLDFLVTRQIPEGEAVYSVYAKCTNIYERVDITKPGEGLYVFEDTDNGVYEANGRGMLPTQNDGLVDAVHLPAFDMPFDSFWGAPILGQDLIRQNDYEDNKPVYEEADRLLQEMRKKLRQVNLELMFI